MARFDILGLQYFTDGGELLGGGKLNFYETGTTTRKDTFSDAAMTIANTNPVTLDADGRAPNIFFAGLAKCVLTDSAGVVLETRDPVGDGSAGGNGFPEWAADQSYDFNQPVSASDGYIYTSLVNSNIGNDPISSPTDWQLLAKTIGFDDANNGYVYVVDTSEPLKINAVQKKVVSPKQIVSSATANASAAIDFNNLDLTLYNYVVVLENVVVSSGGSEMWLRTSTDNGSTFSAGANDYYNGYVYGGSGYGVTAGGSLTSAFQVSGAGVLGADAGVGATGEIFITKANASSRPMAKSLITAMGQASTNLVTIAAGGARNSNTAINAIRIMPSTGNFATGNVRLYSEAKS